MLTLNGHHGKLEWFGGNQDALRMYAAIVDMLHVWDDLVDKDKEVNETTINHAFLTALVYLPANPFYRQIQDQIMPMWITTVSAFETANKFERDKDDHGLEIGHILRYAVGQIIAYAIHVCVGPLEAKKFLPEMWKTVADDRLGDYLKEHSDADHPVEA